MSIVSYMYNLNNGQTYSYTRAVETSVSSAALSCSASSASSAYGSNVTYETIIIGSTNSLTCGTSSVNTASSAGSVGTTNSAGSASSIGSIETLKLGTVGALSFNQIISLFIKGNLTVSETLSGLRAKGAKITGNSEVLNLYVIKFTYNSKNYVIKCNTKAAESQIDNTTSEVFHKNYLLGSECNFTESQINKYFKAVQTEDGVNTKYVLKDAYKTLDSVHNAITREFEKYQKDLILDNFMLDMNRITDSSFDLKRTEDNKILTKKNYETYANEIDLATGEEAKKLRKKALIKLTEEFATGNLANAQVRTILNAIGITKIDYSTANGAYTYKFDYDGKSYKISCNKAAAEKGSDIQAAQVFGKYELRSIGFSDDSIEHFFEVAKSTDGKIGLYKFKSEFDIGSSDYKYLYFLNYFAKSGNLDLFPEIGTDLLHLAFKMERAYNNSRQESYEEQLRGCFRVEGIGAGPGLTYIDFKFDIENLNALMMLKDSAKEYLKNSSQIELAFLFDAVKNPSMISESVFGSETIKSIFYTKGQLKEDSIEELANEISESLIDYDKEISYSNYRELFLSIIKAKGYKDGNYEYLIHSSFNTFLENTSLNAPENMDDDTVLSDKTFKELLNSRSATRGVSLEKDSLGSALMGDLLDTTSFLIGLIPGPGTAVKIFQATWCAIMNTLEYLMSVQEEGWDPASFGEFVVTTALDTIMTVANVPPWMKNWLTQAIYTAVVAWATNHHTFRKTDEPTEENKPKVRVDNSSPKNQGLTNKDQLKDDGYTDEEIKRLEEIAKSIPTTKDPITYPISHHGTITMTVQDCLSGTCVGVDLGNIEEYYLFMYSPMVPEDSSIFIDAVSDVTWDEGEPPCEPGEWGYSVDFEITIGEAYVDGETIYVGGLAFVYHDGGWWYDTLA